MHAINRGLLLVFPKRPFLDWVNSFDPASAVTLDELWREPEALLVPEFENAEEAEEVVRALSREIFEHMLFEWQTDDQQWPAGRDYRMFREWLDVRSLSMVLDQVDAEIEHTV